MATSLINGNMPTYTSIGTSTYYNLKEQAVSHYPKAFESIRI